MNYEEDVKENMSIEATIKPTTKQKANRDRVSVRATTKPTTKQKTT